MALPGFYDRFQHWAQQTVWLYSDPHFSDEDLEYGIKNRPSDEQQIANINACAGRRDTLIILGDVGNIECVRQLRAGYKILIMGNHDIGATKYKREVVKRIFDKDIHPERAEIRAIMEKEFPSWNIRIEEDCTFHSPFERWIAYADNMLFDEVYEGALIVGEKLILSHEPIPGITWAMNLHGHVHSKYAKTDKYHKNFCSDVIGYKPFHLTHWLQKCGPTAHIDSIHRITIDEATERKKKRGGKKINGRT